MQYPDIAEKIIALKNQDLKLRNELIAKNMLQEGYNKLMEELHIRNAEILDIIIEQIGYPTAEKVGSKASTAAWLIIQHAISMPKFMRQCLVLLENAVSTEGADPIHLAYLTDRIAFFEGRSQLYGTQFDWDENGELSPSPYDDLDKVNDRRKAIGMNSLAEQTKIVRAHATRENEHPPNNLKERRKKFESWLRSVGWRVES